MAKKKKIIKIGKQKKRVVEDDESSSGVDNIDAWWDIPSYWASLSYEKKLEWYWRYEFDSKGNRVFKIEE